MLTTHIYLNGHTKDALQLYKNAFDADIKTVIINPENATLIIHSEIMIHNQLLILNDFGDNDGFSISGGYQLVLKFDNEQELKKAYSNFEGGCKIISPMQSNEYTPCQIRFIDRFDVRWAFYV